MESMTLADMILNKILKDNPQEVAPRIEVKPMSLHPGGSNTTAIDLVIQDFNGDTFTQEMVDSTELSPLRFKEPITLIIAYHSYEAMDLPDMPDLLGRHHFRIVCSTEDLTITQDDIERATVHDISNLKNWISIVPFLISIGFAKSPREVVQFCKGGAVSVNGIKVSEYYMLTPNDLSASGQILLRRGKSAKHLTIWREISHGQA